MSNIKKIDAVIDPMNLACGFGIASGELSKTEITNGHHERRVVQKIGKIDSLVGFGAENVVGVSGKAVGKSKEVF